MCSGFSFWVLVYCTHFKILFAHVCLCVLCSGTGHQARGKLSFLVLVSGLVQVFVLSGWTHGVCKGQTTRASPSQPKKQSFLLPFAGMVYIWFVVVGHTVCKGQTARASPYRPNLPAFCRSGLQWLDIHKYVGATYKS